MSFFWRTLWSFLGNQPVQQQQSQSGDALFPWYRYHDPALYCCMRNATCSRSIARRQLVNILFMNRVYACTWNNIDTVHHILWSIGINLIVNMFLFHIFPFSDTCISVPIDFPLKMSPEPGPNPRLANPGQAFVDRVWGLSGALLYGANCNGFIPLAIRVPEKEKTTTSSSRTWIITLPLFFSSCHFFLDLFLGLL